MGMMSEPQESVVFSGNAQIGSKLVPNPDLNRPILVFYIDRTSVTDVESSTGTMYAISAREVEQRPLASAHKIENTFPFFENTTHRDLFGTVGGCAFALNFDLTTEVATTAGAAFTEPISRSDYRMRGG